MSSWFGGGITSLTDQISTFTKEVIAESTQEIEDPVTELQLARKRIEEVERQNVQNREELKRYHDRVKELEDRAETAEIQVTNNNHEYRKLLQDKDESLKRLQKKYSDIQEQQKKLVMCGSSSSSNTASNPTDSSSINPLLSSEKKKSGHQSFTGMLEEEVGGGGESGGFEWLGESPDDVDYEMTGFQSQSQVNQLQSEVARLQVECQHWKDLARSKVQEFDRSDSLSVEDQLQDLQQRLEEERRRHEHELTTLQALHTEQLQALSLHREQPADEENITHYGRQVTVNKPQVKEEELLTRLKESQDLLDELNTAVRDIKLLLKRYQDDQSTQLEAEKVSLLAYLEEMQGSLAVHQQKMADLQLQRTSLESETEKLNAQVETLQKELNDRERRQKEESGCSDGNGNERGETETVWREAESEAESESKRLRNALSEEEEKSRELQRELERMNVEHRREMEEMSLGRDRLEKQMLAFKKETEQKEKEFLAKNILHSKEVHGLKEEIEGLRSHLETRERETVVTLEKLKSDCARLRNELSESKAVIGGKEKDLKYYTELSQTYQLQTVTQAQKLKDLQSELLSASEENGTLRQKLEEATQRLSTRERSAATISNAGEEQRPVSSHQIIDTLSSQVEIDKKLCAMDGELQVGKREERREELVTELKRQSEKCQALTEALEAANTELDRKRDDIESLLNQIQTKSEGGIQQEELTKVKEKNQLLLSEGEKNQKELKRLRSHLIQVEEQNTHEQLQAEHRENQLRAQLKTLQEKINSQDQSQVISRLKGDMDKMANERASLVAELTVLRERHSDDLLALKKLQAVLEDFQQGYANSHEVGLSLLKTQQEIEQLRTKHVEVLDEKARMQAVLDQLMNNENNAVSLKRQLAELKEENTKLSSQMSVYQATIDKSRMRIEEMSSEEDKKVDRALVRNLFLTYLSSQDKKKEEISRLIGKILEIPPDQFVPKKPSWFSQILAPPLTPPPLPSTPLSSQDQKSFSSLFVSFLEAESNPSPKPPAPRLIKIEAPPTIHPSIPTHLLPINRVNDVSPLDDLLNEQD